MEWLRRIILRLRNRKDVSELTADDLRRCPVWEFAIDEEGRWFQDECTIRPRPDLRHGIDRDEYVIVATTFQAADGTSFLGTCSTVTDEGARQTGRDGESAWLLWCMDPHLLSNGRAIGFRTFEGAGPDFEGLDFARPEYKLQVLGKSFRQLFPLRFQTMVRADVTPADGVIPGWCRYVERGRAEFMTRG